MGLVADRGLLNLNNLRELDALRAEQVTEGSGVSLEYVLTVPAARYGEFKGEQQALHQAHDSSQPRASEMTWQHGAKSDKADRSATTPMPRRDASAHVRPASDPHRPA